MKDQSEDDGDADADTDGKYEGGDEDYDGEVTELSCTEYSVSYRDLRISVPYWH